MIRKAQEKDIPTIMDLLSQVDLVHHNGRPDIFKIGTKYSEAELKELLKDNKRPILVSVDEKDNVIGYVFNVSAKSYGGVLTCMVGISAEDEKVTGVEITAISDTPGLGMKATAKDWLDQFIGKGNGIKVNKNSSSDTEIQAITSATITSQAVTDAVNSAFDVLSQVKGGAENG